MRVGTGVWAAGGKRLEVGDEESEGTSGSGSL